MTVIEALPSEILMPNKSTKELNLLTPKEKEQWGKTLCKRLGNATKSMFVDRPNDWDTFTKIISS